jgi:hypothetical protein
MPLVGTPQFVTEVEVKLKEGLIVTVNGMEYEVGLTGIDPSDPSMIRIELVGWVKR